MSFLRYLGNTSKERKCMFCIILSAISLEERRGSDAKKSLTGDLDFNILMNEYSSTV